MRGGVARELVQRRTEQEALKLQEVTDVRRRIRIDERFRIWTFRDQKTSLFSASYVR